MDHLNKRHVKAFYSQEEAESYAAILRKEYETDGARALSIPYEFRRDAAAAADLLEPYQASILEAVQHYVAYRKQNERSCTLRELIEFFLLAKHTERASERHLKNSEQQFGKFARTFDKRTVSTITTEEVKAWLFSQKVADITRKNYHRGLKSLFNFAKKNKYASQNPLDDINLPRLKEEPVGIFTLTDIETLLRHADSTTLPFIAIGAFAGLRAAEIFRLKWEDIQWEHDCIRVLGRNAKTGKGRHAPLCPNLAAWLRPIAQESGLVIPCQHQKTFYRHLHATTKRAGVRWVDNGPRHSFGSYRSELKKDLIAVSWEMGNSPQMIRSHYFAMVRSVDAQAYFEIFPAKPEEPKLADAA
jgi:integrase